MLADVPGLVKKNKKSHNCPINQPQTNRYQGVLYRDQDYGTHRTQDTERMAVVTHHGLLMDLMISTALLLASTVAHVMGSRGLGT